MDTDREIQRAIAIGEHNKEVLELAQNWCAHLIVESWGGVGIVEQMTGLPIGTRNIRCPYAKAAGFAGMDLEFIALDFYERNCVGCKDRHPVRLPNLLELVEKRDRELQRREEQSRLAAQQENARVEARSSHRRILREGADAAKAGIFDILDRLDRAPRDTDRQVLVETARAATDKFDAVIEEALFDLADAGGWTRTEAALQALVVTSSNRIKLTKAALVALARGEAIRTAGPIVAQWLDKSHRELVPPSMDALIHLATPTTGIFDSPGLPGEPEALLAVYRMFPEMVRDGIRVSLRQPDKRSQIDACNAATAVVEVDPDFGPIIAGDMIASLGLPDDHYNEGSAGSAVASALANAMKSRPTEIDSTIQAAFASLSGSERHTLFRTYTQLLWRRWDAPSGPVTPAEERAFSRIVEVLAQRPNDERLRDAAAFLRSHSKDYPGLLEMHVPTLLGAAALISADLDNPYSPLLDPRPDTLKVLEAQTQKISLSSALDTITEAVGRAAARKPHSIGRELLQTLQGLGETHDRLKAALVECLGIMGRSREGLPSVLPVLYSAMMDRSQLVRAAAATAYGELGKNAAEDLPSLVHEGFLVLLRDRYVVVHSAAIHALQKVSLPDRFQAGLLNRLAALINAYSASHEHDRLLSDCIEQFLKLCSRVDSLTPQILQSIIATIDRMEPTEAAQLVQHHGWRLRSAPCFVDLVVKLLNDPRTYEWDLDDLVEELANAQDEEVRRLAGAIQTAESNCSRQDTPLTDDFLDILARAGVWPVAVQIARQAVERLKDTQWDRPRKLHAKARQAAVELEFAAASGLTADVTACAARWQDLKREIEKDDEENREARNPLRGIRLPSPSE